MTMNLPSESRPFLGAEETKANNLDDMLAKLNLLHDKLNLQINETGRLSGQLHEAQKLVEEAQPHLSKLNKIFDSIQQAIAGEIISRSDLKELIINQAPTNADLEDSKPPTELQDEASTPRNNLLTAMPHYGPSPAILLSKHTPTQSILSFPRGLIERPPFALTPAPHEAAPDPHRAETSFVEYDRTETDIFCPPKTPNAGHSIGVVNKTPSSKVAKSNGTALGVVFTYLPADMDHAGSAGWKCSESQICDREQYRSEPVPAVRIVDIPLRVSLEDLFRAVRGGPVIRIHIDLTYKGVFSASVAFMHAHHARAYAEWADRNGGVRIEGCPTRFQVDLLEDQTSRLAYTTFRKVMTQNATRVVKIGGLAKYFWTVEKVREVIVVITDHASQMNPLHYRFDSPLHKTEDIVHVEISEGQDSAAAIVGFRSMSWAMAACWAVGHIESPESTYLKSVVGVHDNDPSLIPYRKTNHVLTASFVRDTCDCALDD